LGTAQERTDDDRFDQLQYLLQHLLYETDFATEEEAQGTGLSLGFEEETKIGIDQAADLAGYLVDWIDTENNRSVGNKNPDRAEQGCPADGLPYEAKSGLLDSIDEIGLVCGFRQLPRTTIERLTRHLTAYDLETNINTATHPVLHAFCAAKDGDKDEDVSQNIFYELHVSADEDAANIPVITNDGAYGTVLANYDNTLITYLKTHTAVASTHFRVAIYGLVMNFDTGTDLARSRLQMDLLRTAGNEITLLYYRED
jgi:hypothetical protein